MAEKQERIAINATRFHKAKENVEFLLEHMKKIGLLHVTFSDTRTAKCART
jgi:hypothetical protein